MSLVSVNVFHRYTVVVLVKDFFVQVCPTRTIERRFPSFNDPPTFVSVIESIPPVTHVTRRSRCGSGLPDL